MVKKSKRLKTLVDLAKHRQRSAAVELGERRKKANATKENLDRLNAFLEDYRKRFEARGKTGIQVRELSEYRSLMQRVNELIRQQTTDWEKAKAELIDLKNAWRSAYQHTHKIEKVMDSAMLSESREQEKRAQNEMDDRTRRRSKSR